MEKIICPGSYQCPTNFLPELLPCEVFDFLSLSPIYLSFMLTLLPFFLSLFLISYLFFQTSSLVKSLLKLLKEKTDRKLWRINTLILSCRKSSQHDASLCNLSIKVFEVESSSTTEKYFSVYTIPKLLSYYDSVSSSCYTKREAKFLYYLGYFCSSLLIQLFNYFFCLIKHSCNLYVKISFRCLYKYLHDSHGSEL